MNTNQEQMANLIEQYWQALESKPNAAPPQGLDSQTIQTLLKLRRNLVSSDPDPEFVSSLRTRLAGQAAAPISSPSPRQNAAPLRFFTIRRWSFISIAGAVILGLLALSLWITRPQPASAQQLLDKARTAAGDLLSVGVKSFAMTQMSSDLFVDDPQAAPKGYSLGETKTWYNGPTVWRLESHFTAPNQPSTSSITVSDGTSQWEFNQNDNSVSIQSADPRSFPSPSVLSLDLLQQDMSNCYDPKVVGEETIAGRAAYELDLGPAKCRSASMPQLNGDHAVWLDKETFFILKSEIRAVNSDQITSALQVTDIKYNLELPGDLFTFTPPQDARVDDTRPQPALGDREFQSQLTALAQRAGFPAFAPSFLPNELQPRAPRFNEIENQIELAYTPADQVTSNTPADTYGVQIYEKLADYDLVRNWTDGAEPLDLDGTQVWVRRGDFDANAGLGSNSAVLVVRDGTLISVSSFPIKPDQLIEIAKSLQPIPGGHAPLPNPTPPSLAEIRATSNFPFLIPTYLPDGLTAEPPTSNRIQYHRADGSVALIVQNAPQGQGAMEQASRFKGSSITLSSGISSHLLTFNPNIVIVWWNQDGGYTSLEGHEISSDEMTKIASSMSATADLGKVEPPPARPTATPIPPPSFTFLKPKWLPETMTVTEVNSPAPNNTGSAVEIHFDPHPGGEPHDVLTLTEISGAPVEPINDAEAITKIIGDRKVTIIKRGEGCITYSWRQHDLSLTLTNPYDPPGPPGQARYSCDQMDKIVESIQ